MRFSTLFTGILTASALFLISLLTPATGRCEFPVDTISNSGITGSFFQPAGYLDDTVLHLAFIGSSGGIPPYKVYYVPIDASADFDDVSLTGDTLRLKGITLVDLTLPAYTDARTPWIFPISDGGVDKTGIAFIADSNLFFALINPNLDNGGLQPAVEDVRVIPVTPSVSVAALSSASDSSGNIHLLYFDSGNIYYASTPFDDFSNPVDNISLGGTAFTPQLAMNIDSDGNAHALWDEDDGSGRSITYYAMTDPDSTAVPGKILIPKTRIFGQEADSFTAPWLSVNATNSIYLSAVSGTDALEPGTIFLAKIDPTLAPRNGSPLIDPNDIFTGFPTPLVIEFSNPVILSDTEDRIHISGNGAGGTGLTTASALFSQSIFSILQNQKPVSLVDIPEPLDKFDRSVLSYFSTGKAVVAWSGVDTVSGSNHIFAISTSAPAFPPQPEDESGCSINGGRTGALSGIAGVILIFAPASFFSLSLRVRRKMAKRAHT
ncbi:MAG: hypothetical protein GTO08_08565 [Deltaproteobacteria bacterium]|nr:hypothetical protein [Deltaproteobacteria bacterium]